MGKGSQWIAASSRGSENDWLCTREAHNVGVSEAEDRRRSKSEMGEGKGGEEESGIELRTRDEKMIPPTYKPKKKCLVSRICGWILVREVVRACDIGQFPWLHRFGNHTIFW
jgi:hypothetical protein